MIHESIYPTHPPHPPTPPHLQENALSDLNQEFTGLKSKFQQEVKRVEDERMDQEYR